jgi:UDP-N-acetylmuramoyl-tripeptide--D-alanyl-D-alanine ligase
MTKQLSLRAIAAAIGAVYDGPDDPVAHISTDSRDLPPGCLFLALMGERFDGHDYVPAVLEAGAAMAVVSHAVNAPPEKLLRVKDTRQAFLDIANLYRAGLEVTVVGITGSVGKTTTKEMIACVCAAGYETLKTAENLNNEIGLSQMMLRLTPDHQVAVLEMAMDGPGQIAPLSKAASPDIAVVTNIGVSHLEAMGTRENIRDEKLSIRAGMPDGAALILNGDDDMLRGFADARLRVIRYGMGDTSCHVTGSRIKEFATHTTFEIGWDGNRFDAQIPCLGRHTVYNALAAFAVGMVLGLTPPLAVAALKGYRPAGMRQKIVRHNAFTVVEDCYNASPDSMRAALKTLGGLVCVGKRIAVLSDMLELGELAEASHREVGRLVAASGADVLLCTGALSALIVEEAKAAGMPEAFLLDSKDALFEKLRGLLGPGDVVWFKASRGMKLEDVLRRIYAEL